MEFWLTNNLRQEPPVCVAEREMRERTRRSTEKRASPSRAPFCPLLGPYYPTTATQMKTSLKNLKLFCPHTKLPSDLKYGN